MRGSLVRIYLPNFNRENVPLGFDLAIELMNRFQQLNSDLAWAKNYRQNMIKEFFSPLTVKKYLAKNMQIEADGAREIADELGVELDEKIERIGFTKRKALIIKGTFQQKDSIMLDYYGVDAQSIRFLETVINLEIEKGKCAIGFDNLQYAEKVEPFENIIRIKVAP